MSCMHWAHHLHCVAALCLGIIGRRALTYSSATTSCVEKKCHGAASISVSNLTSPAQLSLHHGPESCAERYAGVHAGL